MPCILLCVLEICPFVCVDLFYEVGNVDFLAGMKKANI